MTAQHPGWGVARGLPRSTVTEMMLVPIVQHVQLLRSVPVVIRLRVSSRRSNRCSRSITTTFTSDVHGVLKCSEGGNAREGGIFQGFSATTLPFFKTYIGVPCMRALLRATLAARRRARPTAAENSLLVFRDSGDTRLISHGARLSGRPAFRRTNSRPLNRSLISINGSLCACNAGAPRPWREP